ncbi:hypothetical protein D1007_18993 [Hordeum vulgare]|nr:hypothetical protein D1007_18993 [Hordeum vulgare]
MQHAGIEPETKGPKLRRPGDDPPRYGTFEELFIVQINYAGSFCGFVPSKSYVNGKIARFDGCESDTWYPLWLTDFMEQLGYSEPATHDMYWLLPGCNLDAGLRIVDCDTDTLSMIAIVPKFQYFHLFVDHKDMQLDSVPMDDFVICGSPVLPPVLSPSKRNFKAAAGRYNYNVGSSSSSLPPRQHQNIGHELRRSRRQLTMMILYEEWVDDKVEKARKNISSKVDDNDYDTEDDFEDLQGSDVEPAGSAEEVEVFDKQGRKKIKKKVKLKRWRQENMKEVEFHIGMVFLSIIDLRAAI